MTLRNSLGFMKLMAACLLTVILLVCTPALQKRVTIHKKDLTLEQVFMEIRKQTGLEFLYQDSLLMGKQTVTIDVKETSVEEVLKTCLRGQGLGFNIRSGTVIIYKTE